MWARSHENVCVKDDDFRKSPLIVLPFMENGHSYVMETM